jgi:hypothetical protein
MYNVYYLINVFRTFLNEYHINEINNDNKIFS